MVVQGKFALQLIDAETQQPLDEYRGPSGTVHYAVAKENGEYFLRFQVFDNADNNANEDSTTATPEQQAQNNVNSAKATNPSEMMYFRPSVDGKDLGFYTNLTAEQGARDVGLWTYVNGIGTNQALKFESPNTSAASGNSVNAGVNSTGDLEDATGTDTTTEAPPKLYMGNVQVRISKAVFTGQQKRVCTSLPALTTDETVVADPAAVSISASSSLHEDDDVVPNDSNNEDAANRMDPASTSASNSSKTEEDAKSAETNSHQPSASQGEQQQPVPVLRSREGSQRFQEKVTDECPTYKPGELVETITIHYGSTAALLEAGIIVPVECIIPQFVGVSASDTTTANTTGTDKDDAAEVSPATVTATNTAPLGSSLLPATNSTLESVTAPVSLTTAFVTTPSTADEMMIKATTGTPAAVVDPSSPSKGESAGTATTKRGLSATSTENSSSPPAKKACRESTNTREATATTGRVTRATAAVSSS